MNGKLSILAIALAGLSVPASAQMVDVPIWSNGILGQQALRNTYDNYNETHGIDPDKAKEKAKPAKPCSAEALPASERRAMEAEYTRRVRADGKASADAWVREQGKRFHMKLVADGVCPPIAKSGNKVAEGKAQGSRKEVLNKDGKRCTRTRLENRVVANLSGGPMTLALVPVCAD